MDDCTTAQITGDTGIRGFGDRLKDVTGRLDNSTTAQFSVNKCKGVQWYAGTNDV